MATLVHAAWFASALLLSPWAWAPAQAQMKQNWMYASSVPAHAQKAAFPIKDKAIRVVVADPPGSAADVQARAVAPKMAELLGVPVEIDNRPGAGTLIGAQEVLNSLPDGHTLFYGASSTMAQAPHVLNAATFDPLNDFAPISVGAKGSLMLLVGKVVPVTNVAELIAYAKANPGQLRYASSGVGTSSHILGAGFAMNSGIEMVHVPYPGNADYVDDLASGRIQFAFDAAPAAIRAARSGRAKLLAVAAPLRSRFQPDLPTLNEQGISDIDIGAFFAWYAPGGVKPEAVATLHAAISRSLQQASVQALFNTEAYAAESSTPQELTAMVKAAYDAWGELVRRVGIPKQ